MPDTIVQLIDEELERLYAVRNIMGSLLTSMLSGDDSAVKADIATQVPSPEPTIARLPPRLAPVRRERKRHVAVAPSALTANIPSGPVVAKPVQPRVEGELSQAIRQEPASSFGAMIQAAERDQHRR